MLVVLRDARRYFKGPPLQLLLLLLRQPFAALVLLFEVARNRKRPLNLFWHSDLVQKCLVVQHSTVMDHFDVIL